MKKTVVALLIGSIILAPLCAGGSKDQASSAKKTEILISAAASLKDCIQELSAMYTEKKSAGNHYYEFRCIGSLAAAD